MSDPASSAASCIWPQAAIDVDFLAAIIDHVADPIFVKDREFRFVLVNRALCNMVGHERDAMLGKTDYDFFAREEADFFRRKDQEMFSTESRVHVEEEPITDAEGRQHLLRTTKVPLRNADGRVTHLVGIIHDITELKRAEHELRSINEDLERRVRERTKELEETQRELLRKERLAVLGQIAGGLAHQIRNPLGSISNAAFILRRMLKDHGSEDVHSSVQIILDEASHANRIITDLLDNARIRPAIPATVRVTELIEQALRAQKVPQEIEVQTEVPELPPITVDLDQVRTALTSVIENAVEAMGQKGTVQITADQDGDRIVLRVIDSGPGIDENILGRVFEPLISTKAHGLGLGLTTARSLIEAQGGSIRVVPDRQRGACFEIRVPVAKDQNT